jgi:spermidine synthase
VRHRIAAEPPPLSPAVWAVAPLVFGSGLCALVYQTAWQREFRLIFGASTAASAAVVAVFMGGLGLGGLWLGSRADRQANPLRFYAALETLLALTAITTPALLDVARGVYLSLGGTVVLGRLGGTAIRLVLAGLVLLPSTFIAGGTLGAAARAVEHAGDRRRRNTAMLYGWNTLGAVVGCLAATFWLFESVGTRRTLWLAAAANLLVAVVALVLSRSWRGAAVVGKEEETESVERAGAAPAPIVLAGAAAVGFVFFLLELVWYRMLGPILGGTVYTFGLLLAVALAGIAAGGILYTVVFRRYATSLTAFAATCLLEAIAVAVPYLLGDELALLANGMRPAPGSGLWAYLPGWTLITAVVVLPPSVIAGAQFPLLVALLGRGRAGVARDVGRAYFWNTVGGISGALAGGFGLLPLLSAPGCWKGAVVLLATVALAAVAIQRHERKGLAVVAVAGILVVVACFQADGPTAVWRHSSIGVGRANVPASPAPNALKAWVNDMRRSIVWEREGVESSVAVQALAGLSFVVNGKVDGNARNDAPTQVMSGLIGTLLHPGARRSLVIGLGTGSTAGWLAAVPSMERTDVVELEPAILDVARMCGPVNHDAIDNPRVHVIEGDAREVLMAGREKYDLVQSEPSNPYRAGVASLFTQEFYEAVASRLEPRGLFLQWVQAYDVDEWTISTIVATLGAVFPDIEIWQTHQTDLLLVASRETRRLDVAALRGLIREEPLATALRGAWRAVELEDVLARFVAGPALVRSVRGRGQAVNTDDRNRAEFAFARTLSRSEPFDVGRLRRRAATLGADRPVVDGAVDWDRVARQRAAIYLVAGTAPPADAGAPDAERVRAQAYAQYLSGELVAAVKTFAAQPAPPEGTVETTLFAEGLADAGDPGAASYIRALRDIDPTEAEAATARLALRLGQLPLARDALVSAFVHYRSDPWPSQVSMSHALALADELTRAHPEMVPLVFDALREPFAVAAIEEPRRLVRLSVGSHSGTFYRCGEAIEPFEPHVPWRADVLEYRAHCYEQTRDRRVSEARADLEEYRRRERTVRPAGPTAPARAP